VATRVLRLLLPVVLAALALQWCHERRGQANPEPTWAPAGLDSAVPGDPRAAGLPPQVAETLALIDRGGPFPYERDGSTFGNRERLLPSRPRGYYREYTVPTPGSPDRGARRIVTGGEPPVVYYYTDDHYRSFQELPATDDQGP
jgi:guanyl-specific ribonuclease Sa